MRTFKISSLATFKYKYSTVNYSHHTVPHITGFIYLMTGSLYLLTTSTHFIYPDSQLSIQRRRINERTCKNILELYSSGLLLKMNSNERLFFVFHNKTFRMFCRNQLGTRPGLYAAVPFPTHHPPPQRRMSARNPEASTLTLVSRCPASCLPKLKEGVSGQVWFLGGATSEIQFRSLLASLRFKVKSLKWQQEMSFIHERSSWSILTWISKSHCPLSNGKSIPTTRQAWKQCNCN